MFYPLVWLKSLWKKIIREISEKQRLLCVSFYYFLKILVLQKKYTQQEPPFFSGFFESILSYANLSKLCHHPLPIYQTSIPFFTLLFTMALTWVGPWSCGHPVWGSLFSLLNRQEQTCPRPGQAPPLPMNRMFRKRNGVGTSLLRRLQEKTLPDATPPIGKTHPFSNMAVTSGILMPFGI